MNKYKERILYLVDILNEANYKYYKGKPIIEDDEYDSLYKELVELEELYPDYIKEDSPTKNVGYQFNKSEKRYSNHPSKMYSLNKVHSIEDLSNWIYSIYNKYPHENISYLFEAKIDGAAISIDYINGHINEARTRGDGYKGIVVTDIICRYTYIPEYIDISKYKLPSNIEIRGEIYIPLDIFNNINTTRQSLGLSTFSNPRNLASSTLNSKDEDKIKDKGLHLFPYDISYEGIDLSASSKLELLKSLGFNICPDTHLCTDIDTLLYYIRSWQTFKNNTNYLTDGAVIKINNHNIVSELGHTSKYPKWAIAYKYIEESKQTKLKDVKFQVGPSGLITPVAIFEPIELNGTSVCRATLHNESFIDTLDLYIGDNMKVKKAGDIIPKVIANRRTDTSSIKVKWPKNCPSCNSLLIRESNKRTYCVSMSCPSILKQNMIKVCSSDALDINGIGSSLVDKLIYHNLINHPFDIFSIDKVSLIQLDNIKEKSADNIISSINKAREKELYRFIYSLNIPSLGLINSINLCRVINTLNSFLSLTKDILIGIHGIGSINADKILEWLSIETNKATIRRVFDICTNFYTPDDSNIKGTKVYITGKIKNYTKKQLKELLNDNYIITDRFSNHINILITGDKPSKDKISRCSNIGIKVLNWESFIEENGISL